MRSLLYYAVALVLAALSIVIVFPVHAAGERVSRAELQRALEAPPGEFPRGFAIGYIAGIFDATAGVYHCTPLTVSTDEIIRLAVQGLFAKSEDGESIPPTADIPLARAFSEAYPCGNRQQLPEAAPNTRRRPGPV